jgi:hypothetical protein
LEDREVLAVTWVPTSTMAQKMEADEELLLANIESNGHAADFNLTYR